MNMSGINGVIFDMDGVLIDSQPIHYKCEILVLEECGVKATLEDVIPYTGMSNQDRWPRYKEKFNINLSVGEIIKIQERIIMELFSSEELCPVDGVNKLLHMLAEAGLKMAVASSSSPALINLVLERLDQAKYFSQIVSGDDVPAGKPAPDIFNRAASRLGLANSECIVIEDSANGCHAAFNAGIKCVAYRNPNTIGQDLSKANMIIDNFHEINSDLSWMK